MRKILWIEDDAYELEAMIWPLKKDYQVDIALDAAEALDKLSSKSYDLILLDLLIPTGEKDSTLQSDTVGVSLLERIRQNNPNIPVIVFTVVRSNVIEQKLQTFNVRKYLTKGRLFSSDLKGNIDEILG